LPTVLLTGGAGFVGSSLAVRWKQDRPRDEVIAFDSLRRSGSELALPRLAEAGVRFVKGDLRRREDLAALPGADLVIDCAALPSVKAGYQAKAGYDGSARDVLDTNLGGTVECLELCRRHGAGLVFLSTSRVYSIDALRALPLIRTDTRLELGVGASGPGFSQDGITGDFPTSGSRSLYGTSKLCSELLVAEYAAAFGLRAVVARFGVIAGPWQMGAVDQGFFALFAARHLYGGPLDYIGFGGEGLQVRDVLHVEDAYAFVRMQADELGRRSGGACAVHNLGGGPRNSVSLRELCERCRAATGRRLAIGSRPETHPADVPYYVADNGAVQKATGWQVERTLDAILEDTLAWLEEHAASLEPILGGGASR
jgi:CDP-paratose 2-epimerase